MKQIKDYISEEIEVIILSALSFKPNLKLVKSLIDLQERFHITDQIREDFPSWLASSSEVDSRYSDFDFTAITEDHYLSNLASLKTYNSGNKLRKSFLRCRGSEDSTNAFDNHDADSSLDNSKEKKTNTDYNINSTKFSSSNQFKRCLGTDFDPSDLLDASRLHFPPYDLLPALVIKDNLLSPTDPPFYAFARAGWILAQREVRQNMPGAHKDDSTALTVLKGAFERYLVDHPDEAAVLSRDDIGSSRSPEQLLLLSAARFHGCGKSKSALGGTRGQLSREGILEAAEKLKTEVFECER